MATKLNLRIKANAEASKPEQIAQQIRAAVESGKLKPGDALPSERALSEQLGVNRKTVRAAFAHLADEQLIETFSTSNRRVRGATKKAAAPSKGTTPARGAGAAATKKAGKAAGTRKGAAKK